MTQPDKNTNHTEHSETTVTVHSPYHTNWDKPFLRGLVSSEQGVASTSRVSALLIVLVSLWAVVYLVVKTGNIPENILQLGWFSAILIATVYTPTKIAAAIVKIFTRK